MPRGKSPGEGTQPGERTQGYPGLFQCSPSTVGNRGSVETAEFRGQSTAGESMAKGFTQACKTESGGTRSVSLRCRSKLGRRLQQPSPV